MIFFGHRFIKSDSFYHVSDVDSIKRTPPSSTIYLEFNEENLDVINHARENSVDFALKVSNATQLVYASALGAKYAIVSKDDAKTSQEIAENYLFDAKVLTLVESEEEIEELAILGVDGVIFSSSIVKISS